MVSLNRRKVVRCFGSSIEEAFLPNADLMWAHLEGAGLMKAHLEGVTLQEAYVKEPDWITKLKEWKCLGIEEIEEKYEVIQKEENVKRFI